VSGVGSTVGGWIGDIGPLLSMIVAVGVFALVFGIIAMFAKQR
jgi:hypothetical protein